VRFQELRTFAGRALLYCLASLLCTRLLRISNLCGNGLSVIMTRHL
jgi:hypothetical protein